MNRPVIQTIRPVFPVCVSHSNCISFDSIRATTPKRVLKVSKEAQHSLLHEKVVPGPKQRAQKQPNPLDAWASS